MHALVSLWQLDEARFDELMKQLKQRIIPFVRQSPAGSPFSTPPTVRSISRTPSRVRPKHKATPAFSWR